MTGLAFPFEGICESQATPLNLAGLTIMAVSIGSILTLVVWCYRKVLRLPHGPNRDQG